LITLSRTSLDEGSARSKDLYMTTHNRDIKAPAGFEPTIPAAGPPLRPHGHRFRFPHYCCRHNCTVLAMKAAYLYNICNKGHHHAVMNENPVTLISRSRKTTKLAVVTDRCLIADIEKFGLTLDTTQMVSSKLTPKKYC
jgi:hypothetical protein